MSCLFNEKLARLAEQHRNVITKPNSVDTDWYNGVWTRYKNPVVTAEHAPLFWRYDLNPETNPRLIQRLGVNSTFNPGAIELDGKMYMIVRVEGDDRKSFFGIAESENGIDNFKFQDKPILLPQTEDPDVNAYDMRLVKHEDGWIYGMYCSERKDKSAPATDTSAAEAQCGIVRTKDLKEWERLPDLKTPSPQQRNCVLHPEFVNGKYAWYTRPQDGFIDTGKGGGIGFGYSDTMEGAVVEKEEVIEPRLYHTIKEVKNGAGAAPLKTPEGWLHIGHGVRNTATGLRYVIYSFLCDLNDPSKVIKNPSGHMLAPYKHERIGDLWSIVFCNSLVQRADGRIFLYYASGDTTCFVATTTMDQLLDYVMNTPEDPLFSHKCVEQRIGLIDKNLAYLKSQNLSVEDYR